ncbi:unnamed protein product [Hydatigera taeniaeformis]|uniref:Uncharacterized protein n=1 Tax=Hydatigena taeniaeformis TaxID=6205 RepID=A0A0R3WZC5_HYDTA|nr:unnamed protein product [Hydatigera taeniaeformis]
MRVRQLIVRARASVPNSAQDSNQAGAPIAIICAFTPSNDWPFTQPLHSQHSNVIYQFEMNANGSKPNIWRTSSMINSSPLSEGQSSTSPLGFTKTLPAWSSAPPDLAPSPYNLTSTTQEFTQFPFSLTDPCNLEPVSTTNAMARFLLAQVGAAALSSFGHVPATTIADIASTNTTTVNEQRNSRNLFSIANHISSDVKEKEEEGNAHNSSDVASYSLSYQKR